MENTRMMRRKTREQRRKLMRKQKLYGLVFVLCPLPAKIDRKKVKKTE